MNNNRQPQQPTTKEEKRAEDLRRLAQELNIALQSENFDSGKDDALRDILSELNNEAQIWNDHPQLIEIAFPLMILALNEMYGEGIAQTISTIIDGEARSNKVFNEEIGHLHTHLPTVAEMQTELDELKSPPAETKTEEKQPLDLAKISAEADEKQIAVLLSALIDNQNLPRPLREGIISSISDTQEDVASDAILLYTPDNLRLILEGYWQTRQKPDEKESNE
jgi:hypothetical protein